MTKRHIFALISLLLLVTGPLLARSRRLTSYDELMKALKDGYLVRVVIHYGDCELIIDGKKMEASPDAVGGMSMETFEWFSAGLLGDNPEYVVASKSVLIENPLGEGYVFNYVKIRVDEKGRVTLIAQYLEPRSYEVLMDETFKTVIRNTKNKGAACFFADR
jgi:hypothetical protein